MNNLYKKFVFNIVRRYRHSTVSQWVIFSFDVLLFIIAFVVTVLFHYVAYRGDDILLNDLIIKFVLALVLTVFCFLMVGSFRGIIRHAGMSDIWKVMVVCIGAMLISIVLNFVNNQFHPQIVHSQWLLAYRETFMVYTLLAALMVVERLMLQRIYNDYFRRRRPEQNVVIYGAGAAGIIAYNALHQDQTRDYHVVAFIDDDMSKVNQELNGVPVMRVRNVLQPDFIKNKEVSLLIIAIPTIRMKHKQAISNRALDLGLTVKAVPHISTWMNGSFTSNQIEDIKIEDLLGREPIKMDNVNIVREVVDKVVLVTGAAGSIGSEICRQLMRYQPKKVIMLDQAESPMYDLQFELRNTYKDQLERMEFVIANVKDHARMEEVFEAFHPQLVYHAAAYKHVPFMEENAYEAVFVNVFGTKLVADLSIEYGVEKFVMISTDKAVNPTNVMGATKRIAEIYTQSRQGNTKFITTRFGNVLGSNGSVVPLFRKQIAQGGPITVTDRRITRFFMTIPEACSLVLEAGSIGEGGDIFVFDMGEKVKIWDLAEKMRKLAHRPEIEIVETGLRPGEKLYEEVLANEENTIKTENEKIMHAIVRKYETSEVDSMIEKLHTELETCDSMKIVAQMKVIVPEFKSNNSIFSQLDK